MKRNMDLVRCILLQVEEAENYIDIEHLFKKRDEVKDCEYTDQEIIYHVELLITHNFLDGDIRRDINKTITDSTIRGLTWEGQDFLDSVREEKVWRKVRSVVADSVGSTTFDVIKQTGSLVAINLIKQGLGV